MEDKVITHLVFKLVYDEGAKQKYPEIDSTKTFIGKQWKINIMLAFLKLITI